MKAFENVFYFIIKIAILLGIITIATNSAKAQDKTFISNGYEIDYPHFYYSVDTVKMIVQARTYYRCVHFVNVRHGTNNYFNEPIKVSFGSAFTFPYKKGSVIIFTHKKFRKEYKI